MESDGHASRDGSDVFLVALEDRVVECISMEDAIAIKNAHSILGGEGGQDYSSFELGRLVVILKRYDCHSAANALGHRANRARAAEILKKAMADEPRAK